MDTISTMKPSPSKQAQVWNVYDAQCPTRLVLNRIADKWTVLVVSSLEGGTKRFSTLRREIGGVSQKMLTQTLRGLERDGLVTRTIYPSVPPKVEYSLTPLGRTLVSLLDAIRVWSETHIEEVLKAQTMYDSMDTSSLGSNMSLKRGAPFLGGFEGL
ncbi:MAG: helix-turn-helix domain-containing protein [Methylobacter sp.]|nr:helix-turn-helix domain-containing protein [Methylobacter sp.]